MGLLRLWLVLVIILEHLGALVDLRNTLLQGPVAVQGFYILSGFFIQYVLLTHYAADPTKPRGLFDYYASRLFRLFPSYWIILLITLLFELITGGNPRNDGRELWSVMQSGHPGDILYYIGSQALMFGGEVARFMQWDSVTQSFQWDLMREGRTNGGATAVFLIPQGWSMGIEIIFYAVAPFILRLRTGWLMVVFTFCLLVRIAAEKTQLYAYNFDNDFVVAEFAVFLLGVFACRTYMRTLYRKPVSIRVRRAGMGCLAGIVVYSLVYRFLPFDWHVKNGAFLLMLAGMMPVLFHAFGGIRLDRVAGDMAYPIYLSHFTMEGISRHLGIPVFAGACTLSVLLAAFLVLKVEKPVNHLRHRLFYAKKPVYDLSKGTV